MTPPVTPTPTCHTVPSPGGKETALDAEKGQIPDRALYRVSEAEQLLSLSRSAIYEDIRAGRLQSVRRGRSRLIPATAIEEYVQLLINESEDAHEQAA